MVTFLNCALACVAVLRHTSCWYARNEYMIQTHYEHLSERPPSTFLWGWTHDTQAQLQSKITFQLKHRTRLLFLFSIEVLILVKWTYGNLGTNKKWHFYCLFFIIKFNFIYFCFINTFIFDWKVKIHLRHGPPNPTNQNKRTLYIKMTWSTWMYWMYVQQNYLTPINIHMIL